MILVKLLLKSLLLPPGLLIIGVLAGLLIMRRWTRAGAAVVLLSAAMLILLSVPAVATSLYQALLEHEALEPNASLERSGAIVVLTGGLIPMAPEYGKNIASPPSVQRARYAAFLHKRTGKPILVAGGNPWGAAQSEAEAVRQLLEDEMQTPVRWLDEESKDTDDSAVNVMKILSRENIKNIVLVTSDFHMLRAEYLFKNIGFQVVAAPVGMRGERPFEIYDFFPSAGGLAKSSFALNEWYGILWYSLKNLVADLGKS
ncbi:MAG TPA: YdcF family protein [Rhodospirillales bacterium]|nr:YdcF family protein [Rhodospirillales bacterium]